MDGQTERVNQELEQFLRLFVNQRQDDWEELLALGEFQYNNHVHSSTQQTPFMVDSGRHPRMGFEPLEPRLKLTSVNDFVDCMSKGLEDSAAPTGLAASWLTQLQLWLAKFHNLGQPS